MLYTVNTGEKRETPVLSTVNQKGLQCYLLSIKRTTTLVLSTVCQHSLGLGVRRTESLAGQLAELPLHNDDDERQGTHQAHGGHDVGDHQQRGVVLRRSLVLACRQVACGTSQTLPSAN